MWDNQVQTDCAPCCPGVIPAPPLSTTNCSHLTEPLQCPTLNCQGYQHQVCWTKRYLLVNDLWLHENVSLKHKRLLSGTAQPRGIPRTGVKGLKGDTHFTQFTHIATAYSQLALRLLGLLLSQYQDKTRHICQVGESEGDIHTTLSHLWSRHFLQKLTCSFTFLCIFCALLWYFDSLYQVLQKRRKYPFII